VKDGDANDVDVHLYRSMIGSLMYLTASRPDIIFACKKQTVVATSTAKAEFVADASCCRQVLWIQNQLLDYGYNFMNNVINIDNNNLLTKGFDAGSLKLCDKHNMVAFLKKPQGSEDFHQIVDFLNSSHIRIHLKLADADSMSTLPTTEIFEQLALMRVETTLFPTMLVNEQLSPGEDEAITKEMHDRLGRATTIAYSLEVEQGNARPEMLSKLPNELHHFREEGYSIGTEHNSNKSSSTDKSLSHSLKREDEEASLNIEDSSKQGRMIEEIDEDENVNLVKSSKQGEAYETAKHRMESDDTKVVDFSTASPQHDDDEVNLAETLVNIRMSATKDKGKAIMQESKPLKKIKKKEMIQIGHDEELAQKLHAEELAKEIARQEQEKYDFERALELQKQLDERKKVVAKSQAHDIDWSDPAVLRYHAVQNRPFSVAEVRKNMCIYLKNQGGYKQSHFKGMSYEDIRPIFERNLPKKKGKKKKDAESSKQVEEEIVQQDDVVAEQVMKESSRKVEGRLKRKTSKARKDKNKRQKKQDDLEKLTLMEYVEVISDSEEVISVIPLVVKSLIVSWKSYCKEDVGYYEIHRADGSYKTYIFFSEMLNDFDREDLIVLYRLFNEKYASTRPGFDDLMLRGDMKIMFEPNNDDVV
ncbi:hypothetical protein Tco_0445030, partial [Tanacetum coccineum]